MHSSRGSACASFSESGALSAGLAAKVNRPLIWPSPGVEISSAMQDAGNRSEEHTSELQSLMRISYAVFCLKKKTNIKHITEHHILHTTNTQHTTQHNTTYNIIISTST